MAKVLHLCNPGAADAAFDDVVPITSMEELDKKWDQDVEAWFVFAHLDWNRSKLSQNYGFDLALRIRTVFKSYAPIILYSPIKLAYFKQLKGVKYKQLHGPGIDLLVTPNTKKEFAKRVKEVAPLTKTSFHDVRTMLCDLRGLVVDQMNHNLRWGKNIKAELDRLNGLLGTADKIKVNYDTAAEALLLSVKQEDRKGFERLKEDLYKAFDKLIPRAQGGSNKTEPTSKKKHKVLVLDDDENDLRTAKKALKGEFDVIGVRTSEAAIKELVADNDKNDIRAVVCDWRLYKYDGKVKTEDWQVPHQGYGVLEHAAKNGIRALYALTGQDELLVDQMRNLSGIRYALFKKKHLETPEQWAVMRDVLREGCLEATRSRSSILSGSRWLNKIDGRSLRDDYVDAWNGEDWEQVLADWNSLATEAYKYAMDAKSNCVTERYGDISVGQGTRDLRAFMVMRRVLLGMYFEYAKHFTGDMVWSKTYNKIWSGEADGGLTAKLHLHAVKKNAISGRHFLPEERHWLNTLHELNLDDEGTDALRG